MEHVAVIRDDAKFDAAVHGGVPEMGDLQIIFKDSVTTAGNPGCVFTFTAVVDGKPVKVQAVTTVRCLAMAAAAARGWYPNVS
jgi:hypothetical protein